MSAPALPRKVRVVALIVAAAFFMEQMDATVLTTVLPSLAVSFGVSPLEVNLVLTSYLISLTALIPASGRLADRFGARRVFCIAIIVFTVGSVLCGLAESIGQLIAARFLQGAGAALMSPVGRLLLLRCVSKAEMVRAMAWVLLPAMLAPIFGPLIGGFFATYLSWQWIFYINVPIGLVGWLVARKWMEADGPNTDVAFDYPGLLLCGLAVSGLIVGMELSSREMMPSSYGLLVICAGVAASIAYFRRAKGQTAPFINFDLLRIPTFAIATQAGVLFRIGIGAVPFLLPMMLQFGFGLSAFHSGLITFSAGISALVVKMTTVRMLRLLGYRRIMVWNSLLCGLFLVLCAMFRPDWPIAALYAVLLLGGFVRSLQFNAFGTIAFADVSSQRMSSAISLHSTIQQLSTTLGVSISAATLSVCVMLRGGVTPTLADFSMAFLVVAALAFLSTPICARLDSTAGDELSARGKHATG